MRLSTSVYHPECFTCTVCAVSLVGVPFHVDADNNIYCDLDFKKYDESFLVYITVFLLQEICSCVQRLQVCIIMHSDVFRCIQMYYRSHKHCSDSRYYREKEKPRPPGSEPWAETSIPGASGAR